MSGQPTTVSVDTLVTGYRDAVSRFQDIRQRSGPNETFVPLFEALNWAAAIFFPGNGRGLGLIDDSVAGLRCARNRVHHQWADAVVVRDDVSFPQVVSGSAGRRSGLVTSPIVRDWCWKPFSQLPTPDPRHDSHADNRAYSAHLEDKPVLETLVHLGNMLP